MVVLGQRSVSIIAELFSSRINFAPLWPGQASGAEARWPRPQEGPARAELGSSTRSAFSSTKQARSPRGGVRGTGSLAAALSDDELSTMKFLCRDKIRKRRLEAVQSGRELFTILIELQEIASYDVEFLRELLQHIERDDLVSRLRQFEEDELPGDQPDAHEKRLLKEACAVISEYVGKEWKRLMRQLGMSEVKLDRLEDAHRDLCEKLFQALRQWQREKGKDAKVADLIKALRRCSMNFVADMVEERISQLNTGTR